MRDCDRRLRTETEGCSTAESIGLRAVKKALKIGICPGARVALSNGMGALGPNDEAQPGGLLQRAHANRPEARITKGGSERAARVAET